MFVRKVSVCLKPNTLKMFTNLMESELLPWLRTQEGFLDLITLAGRDGIEVQVLSFWDHEANAEAHSNGYPAGVLKILEGLLDGIARGKIFEVVGSTLDKYAPQESEQSSDGIGAAEPRGRRGYNACETGP